MEVNIMRMQTRFIVVDCQTNCVSLTHPYEGTRDSSIKGPIIDCGAVSHFGDHFLRGQAHLNDAIFGIHNSLRYVCRVAGDILYSFEIIEILEEVQNVPNR